MTARPPICGTVETAMGWVGVAVSDAGVCRATLFGPTRDGVERELTDTGAVPGEHPLLQRALAALAAYAEGETAAVDALPVDLRTGSALDRRTWLALRDIPRGQTRTYSWLAHSLGLPQGAARAVGAALGRNPVPIVLPCHRVVGRDGTLRGFGGGLAMKRDLLVLEGALPAPLPA